MRNRVTPLGDIVAIPLRGAWLGNRGILHEGTEIRRFHATDAWITCVLSFRGRYMRQWQPHHYTQLFFHDEAVAFAAGHRPCAECRRADFNAYRAAWAAGLGGEPPRAKELDRRLHGERIVRGTHTRRFHRRPWRELPDGTFVMTADGPVVVRADAVHLWTAEGYQAAAARPARGDAEVITPPATLAVLAAGYPVQLAVT